MKCLICLIPADMDNPVVGWLLYWHVNRVARKEMGGRVPVGYVCVHCGARFTVWQGVGGRDEDISVCWDCVDRFLGHEGGEG